jgi:hypothetical protein
MLGPLLDAARVEGDGSNDGYNNNLGFRVASLSSSAPLQCLS